MNFFERQDRARATTRWLVVLFVLAVVAIIAAVYLVFAIVLPFVMSHETSGPLGFAWWDPGIFFPVLLGTLVVVLAGSAYKLWALSGGGATVARMLGGTPVPPNTSEARERALLNVVEEMAIASGTPVPAVYVLRNERGINAFAAGFTPADAAVSVTEGTLDTLDRDELQGVIAHEFSHILNGDMRLNLRLMAVLNGILVIALIGAWTVRVLVRTSGRSGGSSRGSGRKGGGGGAILALLAIGALLYVVGYVGLFFGRLIKAAVSRQREFLADASAVQFTRNPDGIAGALKKIGGLAAGSLLLSPRREEASHLFFGTGLPRSALFSSLFATHPPLAERIKAIDPAFDGKFPAVKMAGAERTEEAPLAAAAAMADPLAAAALAGRAKAAGATAKRSATPAAILGQAGTPGPEHVEYSASLIRALPASLRRGAGEPFVAQAIAYGLVLSADPARRERQIEDLRRVNPAVVADTALLAPQVLALDPAARLPLLDLTLPALRHLSRAQSEVFAKGMDRLVGAGTEAGLFGYTLRKILLRHLEAVHGPPPRAVARYHTVAPLANECVAILSMLAHSGNADFSPPMTSPPLRGGLCLPPDSGGKAAAASRAFETGLERLKLGPRAGALLPREAVTLAEFDRALDRVNAANHGTKRRILDACAHCVAQDGIVTVGEAELIRAIADTLDCPIPPLVAAAVGAPVA